MYLKSLELLGFKSFPDRTVLNFDSGVESFVGATVIVGPNGSGKSNISDAMRWVLGEISSRNIRGNKMEDVIFGGTDDRRQMNFAEVSVTFNNFDRHMDIAYDEVTVTRRYYRKGDSEYFINRKPVRLKDIHELFMNTGVGREGYSIIGQGKIAEIISQKSEERRTIFEEAAGISKYRYKKEEAESKLSSVDENLTRLNDIMSELEGRVEPLSRECERAKRYLEYYEIKKRDDVSLWLYDMEKLLADLKTADDKLTLAKNELDIINESLSTLENQNERIFEASQESKYKYEQLQRKLDETSKAQHELDSKIKLTENDIAHRETQIAEKLKAREQLAEKHSELEKLYGERENKLVSARSRITELAEALVKLEAEISDTRTKRTELAERLDEELARQKQGEERLVELKIRLSVLDTTDKNDSEKSESLKAEIKKYNESSALLESRIEKAEKIIGDYKLKSDHINQKSNELSAELDKLKNDKQNYIDKANTVYLDYTAKKHRIDAIRRMEELFEGYSQSVRFIMSEYEAGRVKGTQRVSESAESAESAGGRIYGPISRLINVSTRYTLAIETALGANIQNIVVDDENTAKAAIYHLKQKNAGRATFYPISSMKPRYSSIPEVECKKYAGYIGTADSVLKYDEKFDGIIRNLLASTLIFDNIDNGAVMAKATGYRARFVTLDGQVINAGGSFTGGSAKRDSGMLTRRSETEKLKVEVDELSKTLEAYKQAQIDCDRKIGEKNKEISALSAQNSMLSSLSGAENTQLEVLRSQLGGERNMRASLERDLERLQTGFDERAEGIAKLKDEVDDITNTNANIAAKRSDESLKLGELDMKLDEQEKSRGELLISRAEAGKDAETAEHELEDSKLRLDESVAEADKNEQIRESLASENKAAVEELDKMRESIGALSSELEKLGLERADTSVKNVEFEQRLSQLRNQIRDKTGKKEVAFREFTLAESKYKSLSAERDKLTARLWDDYELTHSSAVECAYPPVTDENRGAVTIELNDYKAKLRALGSVNIASIDEYAEVKQRYDFMTAQINDLKQSKENLLEIIFKLEIEMRETFSSAFEEIDRNFKQVFRELFGGGTAELSLTDPENVLESGIEIRVAPPGKIIKSLTLLSGGEQAFVAIALIFAILRVNPTPFCIFDEIEAALDESNVFRFADYLKHYSDKTQFIIITHRRGTMEIADRIYGVTMQERGISKVLSLDVNQAEENIKEKSGN
ncbi:MAG: chromosome segregation protein SMC [Clostridiales bacterium]|nr:chromosome segregation protein SMC [Clostridiales bacterium]